MANFKLRQTGEQIQKDLDKIENDALVKPASAPSDIAVAAVDSTNTQTMLAVGNGLNVKNGALNVTEGTSITISNVSESTEDGGNNVVTFSDGKTLTVKNGKTGATGATGAAGANGTNGKSAYASAQDGGFTGTEAQFNNGLSVMGNVSGIDTTVTQNSGNLITSGAVYSYIQSLDANGVKY